MSRTVCYHLWSSAAGGSNNNLATAQVIKNGKIVGVSFEYTGLGAGTGGYQGLEVDCSNSASVMVTNNPERSAYVAGLLTPIPASAQYSGRKVTPPMSRPVAAGEILSLHGSLISGTAPASAFCACDVFVQEGA